MVPGRWSTSGGFGVLPLGNQPAVFDQQIEGVLHHWPIVEAGPAGSPDLPAAERWKQIPFADALENRFGGGHLGKGDGSVDPPGMAFEILGPTQGTVERHFTNRSLSAVDQMIE